MSGTTITHFRAFTPTGSRKADSDITLKTALRNIDDLRTSMAYSSFSKKFYFSTVDFVYRIDLDGTVNEDNFKPGSGTVIHSMGNFVCLSNTLYDGGVVTIGLLPLNKDGSMDVSQFRQFTLGRPPGITTGYNIYYMTKVGHYFYAIVGYAQGLEESFGIAKYYAGNGIFDLQTEDLPAQTGGGFPYEIGLGLAVVDGELGIARDGVINSMLADASVARAQLWTTNSPTAGQLLAASNDNTTFTWVNPPSGSGSGYEGPADLDVVEFTSPIVHILTETDHLNKLISIDNSTASNNAVTVRLPAASTLSTTDLRFFCRVYATDNKSNVAIQITDGDSMDWIDPIKGHHQSVTRWIYLGHSTASAAGQYIDVYSVNGKYQAIGPARDSEGRAADITKIAYSQLTDATHYVDNGGEIDPREGDYNMALCLLYTSPSPRDRQKSRMPSSA